VSRTTWLSFRSSQDHCAVQKWKPNSGFHIYTKHWNWRLLATQPRGPVPPPWVRPRSCRTPHLVVYPHELHGGLRLGLLVLSPLRIVCAFLVRTEAEACASCNVAPSPILCVCSAQTGKVGGNGTAEPWLKPVAMVILLSLQHGYNGNHHAMLGASAVHSLGCTLIQIQMDHGCRKELYSTNAQYDISRCSFVMWLTLITPEAY
jgi:hypothetical protein